MINDSLQLSGELFIEMNGSPLRHIKNTVVNAGKEWVANRMKDTDGGNFTQKAQMTHIALGASDANSTAGAPEGTPGGSQLTNTTLENEPANWRKALTEAGGTVSGATITYEVTFAPGEATGSIKEAGIFNDAGLGLGDMLARTTFAVVNKGENDTMTITWTVTAS